MNSSSACLDSTSLTIVPDTISPQTNTAPHVQLPAPMTSIIEQQDSDIWKLMELERNRQRGVLELIASENYTSRAVLAAMGTILTNKYAEGYPERRYYGGCEFVDAVEQLAIDR